MSRNEVIFYAHLPPLKGKSTHSNLENVGTPRNKVSKCIILEELRAVVHNDEFFTRNGLIECVELKLPIHL